MVLWLFFNYYTIKGNEYQNIRTKLISYLFVYSLQLKTSNTMFPPFDNLMTPSLRNEASIVRTLFMMWHLPHHVFQVRAPNRNLTKYRANDLCGNLICEYFCWMLGDPHFFFGRSARVWHWHSPARPGECQKCRASTNHRSLACLASTIFVAKKLFKFAK